MAILDRLGRPLRDDPYRGNARVAAVSNLTLSGLQTIDGVTVERGDRVLCTAQTASADNGVYVASETTWSRARDLAVSDDFNGPIYIAVEEGTTYRNTLWSHEPTGAVTVGSTAVAFTQGLPTTSFHHLDDGASAVAVNLRTLLRSQWVTPEMFDTAANIAADATNAIQRAINTGKPVLLTASSYAVLGQLTLTNDYQRIYSERANGTTLDMRYAAGSYQVLIGATASQTQEIWFDNIRFNHNSAATNTMFHQRYQRGLYFDKCNFGNVHKLIMLGDAGASGPAYIAGFYNCEGAARVGGHSHWINVANFAGQFEHINSFVEGQYESPSSFFNVTANAQARIDHFVMIGGYVGRFDYGIYAENERIVNVEIGGAARLDEFLNASARIVTTTGDTGGTENFTVVGVTVGVGTRAVGNGFEFENGDSSEFKSITLSNIRAAAASRVFANFGGTGTIDGVSVADIRVAKLSDNSGNGSFCVSIGAAVTNADVNGVRCIGDALDQPSSVVTVAGTQTSVSVQGIEGSGFSGNLISNAENVANANRRFWQIATGRRALGGYSPDFVVTNMGTTSNGAMKRQNVDVAFWKPVRRGRMLGLIVGATASSATGTIDFDITITTAGPTVTEVGDTATIATGDSSKVIEFATPVPYDANAVIGINWATTGIDASTTDAVANIMYEDT